MCSHSLDLKQLTQAKKGLVCETEVNKMRPNNCTCCDFLKQFYQKKDKRTCFSNDCFVSKRLSGCKPGIKIRGVMWLIRRLAACESEGKHLESSYCLHQSWCGQNRMVKHLMICKSERKGNCVSGPVCTKLVKSALKNGLKLWLKS